MDEHETVQLDNIPSFDEPAPAKSAEEATPPSYGFEYNDGGDSSGGSGGSESSPGETGGGGGGRTILVVLLVVALLVVLGAIFAVAIFAGNSPDTGAETPSDPNLTGRLWQLYAYGDPVNGVISIPVPARYTTTFNDDGTVSVTADCNNAAGTYTADGSNININLTQMTAAACEPGSLSNQFATRLNEVVIYSFVGSDLLLELPADSGTMIMSENPAPAPTVVPPAAVDPALIGKLWKWFASSNPATGIATVPNPGNYTVSFNQDGTIDIQADCNRGGGTYSASGGAIDMQVAVMTRAACPPGSLSDQFVEQLNQVVIYGFEGDMLRMDLPADSGTMQLSENPAPTVDPALINRPWKWYAASNPATGSSTVPNPDAYVVTFQENGTVNVVADCNSGGGTYTANAGSINIDINQITLALCPPGSLSDAFINQLNQAAIYSFEVDTLLLDLPFDSGTLQLAENPPAPPANLVGPTWTWTVNNDPAGAQNIPNPESYAVTFNEDGTLLLQADCNAGGGTYSTNGSLISITVSNVAAADCGPDSLSNLFIGRLPLAFEYFFQGASLVINLRNDIGSMAFTAAP